MPAIRNEVDFNFHELNFDFLKLMAQIAAYASGKYGAATQYTESRLEGNKSPVNHMVDHIGAYLRRDAHDRFGTLEHQLAAIAYNASMEYFYLKNGGPTATDALYQPLGTYDFSGDGKPKTARVSTTVEPPVEPLAEPEPEVPSLGQTSAWEALKKRVLTSGK